MVSCSPQPIFKTPGSPSEMPDSFTKSPITPKLFRFLRELKKNNDRDWFAENKHRYEDDVKQPAVELVRRLEKPLDRVAPMLSVVAKGHGGSVLRIYRDTRFSKDKTPYKTNVGISLRTGRGRHRRPSLPEWWSSSKSTSCWSRRVELRQRPR